MAINKLSSSLEVKYLSKEQFANYETGNNKYVLGGVFHGIYGEKEIEWPTVYTELKPFSEKSIELFLANEKPEYISTDNFIAAISKEYSFITIKNKIGKDICLTDIKSIYKEACDFCCKLKNPNIIRMWNNLPRINNIVNGSENYKFFTKQRSEVFEQFDIFENNLPAASAVGSTGDSINIYFLAGKKRGVAIENPDQISAFNYPSIYGQRSPSFVRARQLDADNKRRIFISGTASILGHTTLHSGDISAQVYLSLKNIKKLFEEAEKDNFEEYALGNQLLLKVYIRDENHYEIVDDIVSKTFPLAQNIIYLKADICRSDLLVEIEAISEQENVIT